MSYNLQLMFRPSLESIQIRFASSICGIKLAALCIKEYWPMMEASVKSRSLMTARLREKAGVPTNLLSDSLAVLGAALKRNPV